MKKRSNEEINNDFKRIRKAAETAKAKSFKELGDMLGLTNSELMTSLKGHPTIFRRIKASLRNNRIQSNLEKQNEKQTEPESEVLNSTDSNAQTYVIDASVTASSEGMHYISDVIYFEKNSHILLTSVAIRELHNIRAYTDSSAINARDLMNLGLKYENIFECVLIDETYRTNDECILKYCSKIKNRNVTLLTCDREMALLAKASHIECICFDQTKPKKNSRNQVRKTLYLARTTKFGDLVIDNFQTHSTKIVVRSNGIEYREGPLTLMVGDDVYIVSNKISHIYFNHYRVVNLNPTDNVISICSKSIFGKNDIKKLTNHNYKAMIREFIHENNIK